MLTYTLVLPLQLALHCCAAATHLLDCGTHLADEVAAHQRDTTTDATSSNPPAAVIAQID